MAVETIQQVEIDQKMRSAYLSYAMSVITARALPDARDGLKPVQRRILYAMSDMGLTSDRPTRKSARIVGEVLGKYHPHDDRSVYEAMVRMAQDFSLRYVLVDSQGNFGSIDGDSAAAMRYTEARLSAAGEELLVDLDKDTVDFSENFDASLREPQVLPGRLPNLLVNGAAGIAVGMATNIPPHNLSEIADAVIYLVDHYDEIDDVTLDDLMQFVRGPDFPTGGTILGREGIRTAYATGKGRILVRAQAHIEEPHGGRSTIIVTELPYQVNKANLVERIATLVRDGRIEGIGDLRDESDRTGMRVVIELKRGVDPRPVLTGLFKYTQMQTTFGANVLALVDGEPRHLSLKRALVHYINHRREVLVRRTRYLLEKAQARAHILEGLLVALDNLDAVIDTIRRSRTPETARNNLRARFKLTEVQAQAILDMQLRRLAALERSRIKEEHEQVRGQIEELGSLLASETEILALINRDVRDLKRRYGDARRTRITDAQATTGVVPDDLVADEEVLVLLTRRGHVRRLSASAYSARSGAGHDLVSLLARQKDALLTVFSANSRDTVVFFTDRGRALSIPAHQLPDPAQQPDGLPLRNLLPLSSGESVVAVVAIEGSHDGHFLCLGTLLGKVKRLSLSDLAVRRDTGTPVTKLTDDDALGWVVMTEGDDELVLVTSQGRSIRFLESTVRPQGASAGGVKGISLGEGDTVVAMDVARKGAHLLIVTANGFAKRTPLGEYGTQGRGGLGLLTLDTKKTPVTGPVAGAQVVLPDEEVLLISSSGTMLAVLAADVKQIARASWGRLVTKTGRGAVMSLTDETVTGVVRLAGARSGKGSPQSRLPASADAGKAPGASAGARRVAPRKRTRGKRPASAQEKPREENGTSKSTVGGEAGQGEEEIPPSRAANRRQRTRRPTVTRTPRRDPATKRGKS
ncbi:MAG TPA: DNA gyrase subunit A [Anaerolineae bacterium]|nr:DNA gyrase subunit A [Anaerolineae bacterium]